MAYLIGLMGDATSSSLAKKEMVGQSSVIDKDKSNIDNVQSEIKNETKQAGMPVLPNDNDTTAEEREIDMLVYKLYDLTDEEIKIIEGN